MGRLKVRKGAKQRTKRVLGDPFELAREFLYRYRRCERGRRVFLKTEYRSTFGKPMPTDQPLRLIKCKIAYELQMRGHDECDVEPSTKVLKNYKATRDFKLGGCTRDLQSMLTQQIADEEDVMAKREKASKGRKRSGDTICARMIAVLGGKRVPDNAAIIEDIQERFPDSRFDSTHLSWYKNRFKQGALSGMDGKPHVINQAEPKADKKSKKDKPAKKTAKKKKITKKRKKDKKNRTSRRSKKNRDEE